MMVDENKRFRILALDGGGAKGFYTLGVLKGVEAMLGTSLHERFDLIFGTSTGAIIAALLALGHSVDQIHTLYKEHVPKIMGHYTCRGRTSALATLAAEVFKDAKFTDMKTGIGVVTARWLTERPMIFKANAAQAHGQRATFRPGFGVPVAQAVQASCSAYPFFKRTIVETSEGDKVELVDGGYCANNPTLYAIADALQGMGQKRGDLRVLNIGVGNYPAPKKPLVWAIKQLPFNSIDLLQKTLEINTQSMDQLRSVLFGDVPTIRISDTFERPEMATDLLEHNLDKLNLLRQRGRESFASRERELQAFLE
jgi:uncharacterized protein